MPDLDMSTARALGKAQWASKGLGDAALASRLAAYKGRIAGSYRPTRGDDIASLPGGWVSAKIDGELWFLVLGDGAPYLASPSGAVIAGELPVLSQASATPGQVTIIAGELHARVAERRCRVGDVSAAMAGESKADVADLCFAAFDLLPAPEAAPAPYGERLATLNELLPRAANLWVVATQEVAGAPDVQALYDAEVASGQAEGLVLRARDGMIYKVKPAHSIDAVVLGYTTKADSPDTLRSILLGLMDKDGSTQVWGACGNLGSDDERKALLGRLRGSAVSSLFRYASLSGGLYTFVKPEVVVEIKVTDLQAEKSDGATAQSMRLRMEGDTWVPISPSPNASPLHPVLIRVREDKKVDAVDVRIAQIGDWMKPPTETSAGQSMMPSRLLRREVWTKEAKGMVAVRKLLVWKTNKEADPRYPAYVVHWTDYSAGRGTPLDREVRLAMNEGTALQLAENMIADNIKKGWAKVT